ncbi:MAG: transporter substrate-binding domain-containing protein [Thermodesulfobacteriota bacterium]
MNTSLHDKTRPFGRCLQAVLFLAALLVLLGAAHAAQGKTDEKPPVTSASEIDYPPFCFVNAEGQADGFSVELMRAALKSMGRDVTFRTGPWPEVRGWLEQGQVQALPLVGRTPEREDLFDFTFPYMTFHGAIVVRKGTKGIWDIKDLKGKRVAVLAGDNAEEYLRREERGIDIHTTASFADALRELSAGRYDAVVIQRLVALRLIRETGLTNLTIVENPIADFTQAWCFAVKEGDKDTLALLNEGLALVMADGTYRHLHAKWFAALELPANRRIVVGGDHNFPPYEYLDENGRPTGYNVDLTRAVAQEMGLDIEIRLGPWVKVRQELARGDIDVLQGMFYSPERGRTFDFTPPHIVNHCVAVVRKGEREPPANVEQLKGLRIVVQDGDIMHDFLEEHGLRYQVTAVDSQEDVLRELAAGNHDCALVSRLTALFLIKKHGWHNLVVGKEPLLSPQYCYAVPKKHQALLAQFSEGLKAIDDSGQYRRIYEKWMGVYEEPSSFVNALRYSAKALVPLLIVLVAALLWSWSLRRQVGKKMAELKESTDRFIYFFESANVGKSITRITGEVDANQALADFLGYSREELSGKTWQAITAAEDIGATQREIDRLLGGEEDSTRFRKRYIRKDGTRVWADVSTSLRRDAGGKPMYFATTVVDINEQKIAEEALRESGEFQRAMFACSPIALFGIDLEGNVLAWNASAERVFGWKTSEVIGSFLPTVPQEKIKEFEALRDQVANGGSFNGIEVSRRRKDGSLFDASLSAAPIYDTAGKIIGAMVSVEDITERKRAREELSQQNELLTAILENIPVMICYLDGRGRITFANKSLQSTLGWSLAEAQAQNIFEDIYPNPDDRRVVMEHIAQAGGNWKEFRSLTRDGRVLDTIWANILTSDGSNIGIGLDVTEMNQAKKRIEHLNRVLRAIREVNQLIVRENDPESLVRKGCRLLVENRGYACALIILTGEGGRPVSWTQTGMGDAFSALEGLFKAGKLPPCCTEALKDGGVMVIQDQGGVCCKCPVAQSCLGTESMCVSMDHGGVSFGYLAVVMEKGVEITPEERGLFSEMAGDIAYALFGLLTEKHKKESEQKNVALERQLVQAQKLEAVGRLAGGVAHDYNNMLSVILGYAEMALEKVGPGDTLQEDLKEILEAGRRSMEITRQLLAFARKQTVSPKVLELNDTVESMLKMLRNLIGEDIDLAWMPGESLWSVRMDPIQVDQVLANLCINARDAIAGNGRITIETANVSFDEAFCQENEGFVPGDYVFLAVSDNGCGMDKETLDSIFEPFFTTKELGKGTGLGLPTVYGIVKQNQGFIKVYSEPGKGTTFKVYLPRHQSRVEKLYDEGRPVTLVPGNETILVVEDEPSICKMTVSMLEKLGYRVLAATTPGEAIRLAREHAGEIHLLMTDVVMPEMNGRALAQNLMSLYPDMKRLFMSGYTANVIAHHGVLDEGVHFIQKPFSVKDLAAKVREALEN